MKYTYTFIALAAVAFIIGGCNNDASEKTASRPAGTKVDANDIPVNTSPGQKEAFDPAKEHGSGSCWSNDRHDVCLHTTTTSAHWKKANRRLTCSNSRTRARSL